jgi:hypothetical protein
MYGERTTMTMHLRPDLRQAIACGVFLAGCGGSKPFVLGAYDASGTPAYVCRFNPSGGSGSCDPDLSADETRWKKPGTVYVPFEAPLARCDTGIQRILIENPQSGFTTILIECARRAAVAGAAAPF